MRLLKVKPTFIQSAISLAVYSPEEYLLDNAVAAAWILQRRESVNEVLLNDWSEFQSFDDKFQFSCSNRDFAAVLFWGDVE